ncbi:MAG: beta-ketoacyl-ACP synthase II [Bacteroidetes bacterium]|jgi:3-oxoacyl-[acyl-carrier-protein] synthase II|nr:beta-ketoacyl-ACP synthase II [Bacteroidota bacterium]
MQFRRVVVTGLGAITPIGNTLEAYWEGLSKGVSGAALTTQFDTSKFKTKFSCEVKNFDPNEFIDKKEARRMDRFTQFAIVTTDEAIKDAGLTDAVDKDRVGVIWGTGIGGLNTFLSEVTAYAKGDGTPRFSPFFIPMMIGDISAGLISIRHGYRGPNFVTVSACASSTNAIADAFNYIRLGKADIMITGGSEAGVNEAAIGGFNAMKALSERNDSPETASRPFDLDRDGFVLGEGGGALVLESLEHALARGAKIYAEVAGCGLSADAYHMTAPHPDGLGASKVMQYALEDAGIQANEIDYINVHGTSTPLGDPQEIKAISTVFGDHAFNINISSTKSMTGHLLGGAGAIEAIACIMAIHKGIIPPTINHFTDDPAFDTRLNLTFNKPQHKEVKAALSNTFGFGGHNASVILKKYSA